MIEGRKHEPGSDHTSELSSVHTPAPASGRAPAPTSNLPTPRRALAIGAHPDDVEFGCGGTLAKWAAAGCEVHHLVCTDGSKGSWDPGEDAARLVDIRQGEQRDASKALGGEGRVVFLGRPDGELASGIPERAEVCAWIRRVRPDVVLGHDPWKRYRLHPDHRHAGYLATEGVVAARDPHYFPEQQLPAHRPEAMLLWEADQADHVEDIAGFVDAKVSALLAHRSQWRSTMGIYDEGQPDQIDAFEARVRSHSTEMGAAAGIATGEAFKLLRPL